MRRMRKALREREEARRAGADVGETSLVPYSPEPRSGEENPELQRHYADIARESLLVRELNGAIQKIKIQARLIKHLKVDKADLLRQLDEAKRQLEEVNKYLQ